LTLSWGEQAAARQANIIKKKNETGTGNWFGRGLSCKDRTNPVFIACCLSRLLGEFQDACGSIMRAVGTGGNR
jgi:hypothetical protein